MKTLTELTAILDEFRDARGWAVFHTPAELARALMVEAAELNRAMLWNREPNINEVAAEIADIMIYALYLAAHYKFVPELIIEEKIQRNGDKYPANSDHAKQRGWRMR